MKKILLFFCLLPTLIWANFVELDLQGKGVTTTEVVNLFADTFKVSASTFVLVNERYDKNGFMHQNYQQFVDGVIVENCMLIVHSKNGYVTIVNGDVMLDSSIPHTQQNISASKARRISMVDDNVDADILFMQVLTDSGFVSHKVYKVCDTLDCKYIDVNTGDVVRVEPYVASSYTCTMPTMYSGTKTVECEKNSNNKYILKDNAKHVSVKYGDMGYAYSEPSNSYVYTSTSTNWSGHYLTSITVNYVNNDWWEILGIGDLHPDLYITIENGNGAILYTSDYKEDVSTFPVEFHISEAISIPSGGGGYVIRLWDDDIDSDQEGANLVLTNNAIGKYHYGSFSANADIDLSITSYVPAFDVFWGVGKAFDFYQQKFQLNSFDDNGTDARVFLHRPESSATFKKEGGGTLLGFIPYYDYYNNAMASSPASASNAYLYFGMGSEKGNPEVGINTIVHEYTHLVTAYRPNKKLVYSGESGALNEGYSDAMAEVMEYWLTGSCDWLYDITSKCVDKNGVRWDYMRDLAHPQNGGPEGVGKPTTYGGTYWGNPTDTSNDHGYVHNNNSVFTYWFYLLAIGGSGKNDNNSRFTVSGIGMDAATAIAWRMHREYLPANCTFAQARHWAIQSAKDLYPNNVAIERAVTNAWHAVGVGEKYKEEFSLTPGRYAIVASRATEDDNTFYYMTATKDGSKDRFVAVNTNATSIDEVNVADLDAEYIWDLEKDGSAWNLKNDSKYVTWSSGNSAKLDATGRNLTMEVVENQVQAHFYDGTAERYLSLNATTGNNYFAFYGNKNQITYLSLLPIEEDEPEPPVTTREYYIVAKRSTGNYYFFTPNKVSGKDRLIAVDAGTSVRSQIDTVNTTDAYLWTLEDSGTGKLLKSHNGEYLTCTAAKSASMASTGTVLNMANNDDGTVTFTYVVDATTLHYLSLATARNDYFVFYANANQVTHLLLMPKGDGATPTNKEDLYFEPQNTDKVKKMIIDNQLFIFRGDKIYNAAGVEL